MPLAYVERSLWQFTGETKICTQSERVERNNEYEHFLDEKKNISKVRYELCSSELFASFSFQTIYFEKLNKEILTQPYWIELEREKKIRTSFMWVKFI